MSRLVHQWLDDGRAHGSLKKTETGRGVHVSVWPLPLHLSTATDVGSGWGFLPCILVTLGHTHRSGIARVLPLEVSILVESQERCLLRANRVISVFGCPVSNRPLPIRGKSPNSHTRPACAPESSPVLPYLCTRVLLPSHPALYQSPPHTLPCLGPESSPNPTLLLVWGLLSLPAGYHAQPTRRSTAVERSRVGR